jgi:hypothetical protein
MVTALFPVLFGLFYQVSNSVKNQLITHQLFNQFDRFHIQLQRDEANGVKLFAHRDRLEMVMKDGLQVCYQWKQDRLIRSVKPTSSSAYQGYTILLYHVKEVKYQNLQNGVKMTVVLADQTASYTGMVYIWGRLDE